VQLPITSLVSLDLYRDGGSVSISFRASEPDKEYCLRFPIKNVSESLRAACRTFHKPILETYTHTVYTSPVTGFSCASHKEEECSASWQQARSLLAEAAHFLPGFVSDYLWVHGYMVAIAENEGAITGS
jgi:hypothetical protein